ncbi:MAG: hypothetical protein KBS91_02955 [Firmicutes bacterium]|nr:hypothetical protein [Candidatus Caballimonas caccae]
MAINTPLDEIIDYKDTAIKKMLASQEVMSLIFDTPNIDMDSDEVYHARERNFFDYGINPDTIQTDTACIFVQASAVSFPNDTMKRMAMPISILCNVNYVELSKKKFKATKGNRLDNIARQIIVALEDENQEFGLASYT